MSLLTICQGVAGSLDLPVPDSIVGAIGDHAVLLLRLAKREGRELMRRHDWQALNTATSFTTVATLAQSAVPSDFDRFEPYSTLWNTDTSQFYTQANAQEWQQFILGGMTAPGPGYWLYRADSIRITPIPTAGQTVFYNYISKNYCASSGGTAQADWAADSDVGRIPEHLIELGVVWRFLRAKGFDYAEELATYEREVEKAAARDRGPPQVSVVGAVNRDIILDQTWHGTITEV